LLKKELLMKKMLMVLFLAFAGFTIAQDEAVPYFQGPYFERFYSPIDFSELATLEVTLAIREVVQSLGDVMPSEERPAFTFVSRQEATDDFFDLVERMYSPVYLGETLAFREWLETYYTQNALATDMQNYYYDDFYREALAGSDDFVDTKDFADVLMMFLTASYIGANLITDGTPAEQDLAVRQQVRVALAQSPRFAALSDDEKQQGALLLLFFTSRIFADFNSAISESTCAANDTIPGPAEATFYCGRTTELDLVGAFAESIAQIFGFRVREFVLTDEGFVRFLL
jgi:hypothetical protein